MKGMNALRAGSAGRRGAVVPPGTMAAVLSPGAKAAFAMLGQRCTHAAAEQGISQMGLKWR